MKHDRITCPHCGGAIEISEVLVAELRADLEQRFDKEKQAALSAESERAEKRGQQAV